jgi:hypothetical protein
MVGFPHVLECPETCFLEMEGWAFLLEMKLGMGRNAPEIIFSRHFENWPLRPTFVEASE